MFSIMVVMFALCAYWIGLIVNPIHEQRHKKEYVPTPYPQRTPYEEEKHQEMLDCLGDEARKNYNERSGRSNYAPSKRRK